MNFKNETGYAKRQTYRTPIHSTGQSASSTDQPKTEIQQTQQNQVSSQTKTIQLSAALPNTTSQEPVEPQSTDLESTSQHFATTSGSQPQTSTSKCFLVTCVIVQYIQF